MGEGTGAGAAQGIAQASATQAVATESADVQPTGRQRVRERLGKRNPTLKLAEDGDDEGFFGQIADEFDKYDKSAEETKRRNAQLNKLFKEKPEAAEIFRRWARGESDPFSDIVDNYSDILEEAMQSADGAARLKKARAERERRRAENEAADKAYEGNVTKSITETLRQFADENGLSDDEAGEIFMTARQHANDAFDGIFSREYLQMIHDGRRYRKDVARAREEGEVSGRNEKIRRELRKSASVKQGPPTLSGQGVAPDEKDAVQSGKLSMFGIPIKKVNK